MLLRRLRRQRLRNCTSGMLRAGNPGYSHRPCARSTSFASTSRRSDSAPSHRAGRRRGALALRLRPRDAPLHDLVGARRSIGDRGTSHPRASSRSSGFGWLGKNGRTSFATGDGGITFGGRCSATNGRSRLMKCHETRLRVRVAFRARDIDPLGCVCEVAMTAGRLGAPANLGIVGIAVAETRSRWAPCSQKPQIRTKTHICRYG